MTPIVLGGGPSSLRAASRLAGATRLVPRGETRDFPELPEDRGVAEATDEGLELLRTHYGAAPQAELDVGLWAEGRLFELPLRRRRYPALFPPEIAVVSARAWARTRGRVHLRKLIGGGLEQRNYRDWAAQRFGEGVFDHLYAAYGEARFGDPEKVNISAARLHHSLPARAPLWSLGGSPEAGWQRLSEAVADTQEADITGLEVRGGGVSAVLTDEGRLEVDGSLWCAVSPDRLVGWLGDQISIELRNALVRLRARHRVQVALRRVGGGDELPAELHITQRAPFFRVSRPERLPGAASLDGALIAHLSLSDDDPLWRGSDAALVDEVVAAFEALNLPRVEAQGARVDRIVGYDPEWIGPWHPTHVRITDALSELGIHLVGRAGTHRFIDAAAELQLVDAIDRAPRRTHEHVRVLLDPPVTLADQDVSFTRFIER